MLSLITCSPFRNAVSAYATKSFSIQHSISAAFIKTIGPQTSRFYRTSQAYKSLPPMTAQKAMIVASASISGAFLFLAAVYESAR